jgi:predicted amidophosphoribosyltransferase
MAKKQAPKKPVEATKGPGVGKKLCPHCNAAIAARSLTCPECGEAIKPKKKKRKARKAAASPAVAPTKARASGAGNGRTAGYASQFIKQAGGIDKAIELLTLVKEISG